MSEPVKIGRATLYLGDCLDILPTLGRVDTVVTDPPFFRVKPDGWDRQWADRTGFYDWSEHVIKLLKAQLAGNGSLYWFAWAEHAAMIEVRMRNHLEVLNHIVWRKGSAGKSSLGWMQKAKKENLRAFLPETERVLFAAHYGADSFAMGASGYDAKCDELRGFLFEPLRAYLEEERDKAGFLSTAAVDAEWQNHRGTKGCMASHWFGRSQWELPTRENYEWLRHLFNQHSGDHLKREYDHLKREYDDLKREYDDLRRPFNLAKGDQWSDVWDFDPVPGYAGKHPCEKPLTLMAHILKTSTRYGQSVCDPFMGSGTTGVAAVQMGRSFIGIELDPDYFDIACKRIEEAYRQPRLFDDPKPAPATQERLDL